MNVIKSISSSLRSGRTRLAALVAMFAVAGVLAVPGAASAQSAFPETRADCANWSSYTALDFDSRADCVAWVNDNNSNGNGYGGGGGGGGLGGFLSGLFDAIGKIFQLIGSLLGRLF